jgi:hypothetical protein
MISKQKIKIKMFKQTVLFAALFGMTVLISSCFVDYGLNTSNYDLVVTDHNSQYNFGAVTKFAFIDSVVHYGTDEVTRAYDNQIKTKVLSEVTALGWQRVYDSTANLTIMLGTTSSTTTVYGYYDWWGYYGWYGGWSYYPTYGPGSSYYYPYYPYGYETAYSYTTASLVISMADPADGSNNKLPIEWMAVMNGLVGLSDASTRINSAIDQAFSQSPYLRGQ